MKYRHEVSKGECFVKYLVGLEFCVVGFCLTLLAQAVNAGGKDGDDNECPLPPREVCFNILCSYEDKESGEKHLKCEAAAAFQKQVTYEGNEMEDNSSYPDDPEFEVVCDGQRLYRSAGRRFTDAQGTRIQAQGGPFPAILLPRGVLDDGHRYALSSMELENRKLRGHCYIYTGPR